MTICIPVSDTFYEAQLWGNNTQIDLSVYSMVVKRLIAEYRLVI